MAGIGRSLCIAIAYSTSPVKNKTGMTPQRYLTRLRLLQARHQLCYSDNSVTDIAYLCGFGDSNHFSTLFKREFSQSPRDLRSQL